MSQPIVGEHAPQGLRDRILFDNAARLYGVAPPDLEPTLAA